MLVMAVVAPAMRNQGVYWIAFSLAGLLVLVGFIVAMLGIFQGSWRAGGIGVAASLGSLLVGFLLAAFTFAPELVGMAKERQVKSAQEKRREDAKAKAKRANDEFQYEVNPESRPRSVPKMTTPVKLTTKRVRPATLNAGPPYRIRTGAYADGTAYSRLDLDTRMLLPGSCLSADGGFLFILLTDGTLQKISVPQFAVVKELKLAHASCLALTKAGIVVARSDEDDLVVVDPAKLQITSAISLEGVGGLSAGGAASPYLFVEWDSGLTLRVIDVSSAKLVADLDARDITRQAIQQNGGASIPPIHFEKMCLTRDGSKLFAKYKNYVHRFRIRPGTLVWEAMGQALAPPNDASNPVAKEWFNELCSHPATGECYWGPENQPLQIMSAAGNQPRSLGDGSEKCFDHRLNRILMHPKGYGFLAGYGLKESVWIDLRKQSR